MTCWLANTTTEVETKTAQFNAEMMKSKSRNLFKAKAPEKVEKSEDTTQDEQTWDWSSYDPIKYREVGGSDS